MENKLAVQENQKSLVLEYSPDELISHHKHIKDIIQRALRKGTDYGPIPGTKNSKDVLHKPGAESITLSFGARPVYSLIDKESDHFKEIKYQKWDGYNKTMTDSTSYGLYRYVYKCQLLDKKTNRVLGEGEASCSTMESKFISRPRDSENSVLKMAQKRSFVAATINTFGLSGLFTQDLEDLVVQPDPKSPISPPELETRHTFEIEYYTEKPHQKKLLMDYAKEFGLGVDINKPEEVAALKEISKACLDCSMNSLKDKVKAYIENPYVEGEL